MRLEALFRPKSIAVVGASDKPTIGRRLIASLDRIGFAGPIFPINPNYSAVSGRQCYANVAELPETPDVAVFCVGHARVLDTLLAAAARGVRGAVIYDGGFAERGEGVGCSPNRRDLPRRRYRALRAQLHGSAQPA
jgi:acetyltransferase